MKSLKSDSFSVLLRYGSEDGVLNMEKVEEGNSYLPADYAEICIEGGNHAQFGNYGEQKSDHAARISREEQQVQTVEAILNMAFYDLAMERYHADSECAILDSGRGLTLTGILFCRFAFIPRKS